MMRNAEKIDEELMSNKINPEDGPKIKFKI